jgi:Cu-processing system ATP-binding protein
VTQAPFINVTGATKTYGAEEAVRGVDLQLLSGHCHALVGHNGAGKSTLIKMVLGLVRATSGTVQVFGLEPGDKAFDNARRRIGFLPEQVLFQGTMTGFETLKFYARLKGAGGEDLDALFDRVELAAAAKNRVGTYSKGMRQRLGLAQALIGKPDLLILDEPTSGLDPASRQNVYRIIDAVKADGAGVLISSHALSELDSRVDEVTILDHGRVAASGTIPALREGAGLASQIRIKANARQMPRLAKHFSGEIDKSRFLNGNAILDCRGDEKMQLLEKLMTLGVTYENIDITEPSLEDVFAAYTKREVRR